jgi:hypothetical protein
MMRLIDVCKAIEKILLMANSISAATINANRNEEVVKIAKIGISASSKVDRI